MTTTAASEQALSSGRPGDRLEPYRGELTGYCYRMLGSAFDADDAVQETMVRAWRALEKFDGRSTLRSWLYRIATNVCYDHQAARQRRAMPMDMSPSASPPVLSSLGTPLEQSAWVEPIPDGRVMPDTSDPAELAVARESVHLAFVAALQHLPARQRAVLILREVLRWKADEVAELLDTTVASVNSALQRARATLAASSLEASQAPDPMDDEHAALLARYVEAFERYDVASLVSLLHEDAVQSMPPYALWLRGAADIGRWFTGTGAGCRGARMVATEANGRPAFGTYRVSGPDTWDPFSIQIVDISGGLIVGLHSFLYPELFPAFGLPARLER
ncbi:MAG: sigma-70 family RNA polymerase sigma factor [Actinomycetota bacterium]|nr:sigma-70 family RNA polymerase sigma factor [Actinomycetota bacterium]